MHARGWWPPPQYFWTNQLGLFEREADQALALAPYDGENLVTLGHMLAGGQGNAAWRWR